MAKMRKVTVVRGYGNFIDPFHVKVDETSGDGQETTGNAQDGQVQAGHHRGRLAGRAPAVHARTTRASSTPPARWSCATRPKRMLIVGGGIIGLEMGTVYSTLGARLDVVEMLDGLMQGADRDLVKVWQKMNAQALRQHPAEDEDGGRRGHARRHQGEVRRRGRRRASELYDLVLQAVGRTPNGKKIGADKAGVDRRRPRLHPGGRADAHQRAAHLRDRRHRRPADAGAQGGARGPRGGRSRRRATQHAALRRPRDPERGLHRPRGGVGGPDRGPGQGAGHRGQEGPVPVDGLRPRHRQRPRRRPDQAAVRRRRRTASWAAASSA